MELNYRDGINSDVKMFIGEEVDSTPAFGLCTLFVVGLQSPEDIRVAIEENILKGKHISHIFFGANKSFKTAGLDDYATWSKWGDIIKGFLTKDMWCTLDMNIDEVEGLAESGLCEYRRFIPMLSVKIPYIKQLNYNAVLKIDDKGFDVSNPGVWCYRINSLLSPRSFTDWDKYKNVDVIK